MSTDPSPALADADTDHASDFEAARRRITNLMAAGEIAAAGFPAKDLPRVASLPFVSLGHQILLDYDRFARLVWSTALSVDRQLTPFRRLWWFLMGFSGFLAVVIGFFVSGVSEDPAEGFFAGIGIGLILVPLLSVVAASSALARRPFATRAAAVESLLHDTFAESADFAYPDLPPHRALAWGDASVGGDEIPVILSREEDRFPGFGKVLIEQSLVCPQDRAAGGEIPGIDTYQATIAEAVRDCARRSALGSIRTGPVLMVDARSIQWSSPLLTQAHCPRLKVSPREAELFASGKGKADCRLYWATLLVFPTYLSTATVFIRPYLAGRAACCEVAVALLGPPVWAEADLRDRLLSLRRAASGSGWFRGLKLWKPKLGTLATRLELLHGVVKHERKAGVVLKPNLRAVNPRDERGIDGVCRRILLESDRWIGDWYGLGAYRSSQSYVLTPDVFGRMEVKASLRALYLQISEAVLEAIEGLGFDASSYRDEKGHLTVSAERIDSLVVGEKIVIERAKPSNVAERVVAGARQVHSELKKG